MKRGSFCQLPMFFSTHICVLFRRKESINPAAEQTTDSDKTATNATLWQWSTAEGFSSHILCVSPSLPLSERALWGIETQNASPPQRKPRLRIIQFLSDPHQTEQADVQVWVPPSSDGSPSPQKFHTFTKIIWDFIRKPLCLQTLNYLSDSLYINISYQKLISKWSAWRMTTLSSVRVRLSVLKYKAAS